ncbi:hypothetical protein LTS02_017988, partial [Friedmanniomyces endolithicus]
QKTSHPPPNESVVAMYEPWSSYSTIGPKHPMEANPIRPTEVFTVMQNDEGRRQPSYDVHGLEYRNLDHPSPAHEPPASTMSTGDLGVESESQILLLPGKRIEKEVKAVG